MISYFDAVIARPIIGWEDEIRAITRDDLAGFHARFYAPANATLDQVIPIGIRVARAIGSPAYPAPEEYLRERIARDYARSFYPEGPARQIAAIMDDGDRRKRLKKVTAPTLVIHGTDDPLVPVEGGRDTARAIPGAKLHEIAAGSMDLAAHEVAHLVHLNHGPRFWALARTLCEVPIEGPQGWLKKNGEVLLQYGG